MPKNGRVVMGDAWLATRRIASKENSVQSYVAEELKRKRGRDGDRRRCLLASAMLNLFGSLGTQFAYRTRIVKQDSQ